MVLIQHSDLLNMAPQSVTNFLCPTPNPLGRWLYNNWRRLALSVRSITCRATHNRHSPLLFHCWNLWYSRHEHTQHTQLSTINVSTTPTQTSAKNLSYCSWSLYLVPVSGTTATSSNSATSSVKLRCSEFIVTANVLLPRVYIITRWTNNSAICTLCNVPVVCSFLLSLTLTQLNHVARN
jgi:hypothetical protein